MQGPKKPLLGKPPIEVLNIIKMVGGVDVDPKDENPALFRGLGKPQSTYKIELNDNTKPFNLACPRRIALLLRAKVEEEIKSLQEHGIIKPVKPTDWCAPVVAVEKKNGKVRLCCDFSKLNESVRRENFQLPTTEQLLAQ